MFENRKSRSLSISQALIKVLDRTLSSYGGGVFTRSDTGMNRWTSSSAALLMVFLLPALSFATQDPVPTPAPTEKAAPTRPDSRSDWTLEISTSGGLDGKGSGGFTLTSAGVLTCSLPKKCSGPTAAPTPVHGLVITANLPPAKQVSGSNPTVLSPVAAGICMDCVVTTMSLRIRESNGLEWTYSLSWDPTTLSSIPSDFRQIFQAAAALAK